MGSAGGTEQVKNEPLPEQYAQLRKLWNMAGERSEVPLEFFPGSTVGQRDVSSIAARDAVTELSGPDYTDAAQSYLGSIFSDSYLRPEGGNPILDDRFRHISDQVREQYQRTVAPSINTRFVGAGRGSSAAADRAFGQANRDLATGLARVGSDIYYSDYENRLRDRMQALGLVPTIRGVEYGDIAQQRGQGAIEEEYTQRLLNDRIARFNFAQSEPDVRLDRFANRVGQNNGFGIGQVPSSSPPNNTGAQIGLGIAGLLSTIIGAFAPPVGAGLGAATAAAATAVNAGARS